MHPVVRMRFIVRAFLNGISCVYVEPVNRSTYVVPERNGKFFWRLLYHPQIGVVVSYKPKL